MTLLTGARRWRVAAPLAFTVARVAAQAPATPRVALVVGNAAYPAPATLANPGNDARAVAATLRKLGFTVVELHDGTRDAMLRALDQTLVLLRGRQGIGLFYYAGHGMQLNWHNFMVPVDARLARASDLVTQAIDVDRVVQAFKSAGNRMNFVLLDACRDNPFGGQARGLAQVDAPPGTLIAYATAPGNVAEDGDVRGGNGLYTQHLLREMTRPAPVEAMFKRVRLHVRQQSQGRQIPWESTSLEEDFSFAGPSRRDEDFERQRAEWERIRTSRNPNDFYAFLQRWPNGYISEQAAFMLEQLAVRRTVSQPDRAGVRQDPGQPRFRVGDVHVSRTIDTDTGREVMRNNMTVQRIANGLVYVHSEAGQTIRTLDGGYVEGVNVEGRYRWDPPRLDLPGGELMVGKRWTGRTVETELRTGRRFVREDRIRIVAQEEIAVPAGKFVAYRLDLDSDLAGGTKVHRTYWVQPGWAMLLRLAREVRRPGKPPQRETSEMLSRTFGKG